MPMFDIIVFGLISPAIIAFAFACAVCWKWQSKTARLLEKMDRNRPVDLLSKMSAGGDWWACPRSSGNRAFEENRAETLRLLEEEQRDLHDFLDRLRHAKDKAEFDQFMAERFIAQRRKPATFIALALSSIVCRRKSARPQEQ